MQRSETRSYSAGAYSALNATTSWGFSLMTALVHCFKISGSTAGTLICSAEYNGSASMMGDRQGVKLKLKREALATKQGQHE